MKFLIIILAVTFSTLMVNHCNAAEKIFGIYATSSSHSKGGTAFLISNEGDVVTAYHVIQDSYSVSIHSPTKGLIKSENATVRALDVEHDLAILNIPALAGQQAANFSSIVPDPKVQLKVVGYPRGMPNAEVRARTLYAGAVRASRSPFRTERGLIFADVNVEIIPLDMTIYGGMSGAPLMDSEDNVIGVVSGSLNEGGSFAWAIPAKYVKDLLLKKNNRVQISEVSWSPATLLSSYAINSARSYSTKKDSIALKVEYRTALEKFRRATERMKIEVSTYGMTEESLCASLELAATRKYPVEVSSSTYPSQFNFSKKTARIYNEILRDRISNSNVIRTYISAIQKLPDQQDIPSKKARGLESILRDIELRRPEIYGESFEKLSNVKVDSAKKFEKTLEAMSSSQTIDNSTASRAANECNAMYGDIAKYNASKNSPLTRAQLDDEIILYDIFSKILDVYVEFIAYR